MSDKSSWKTPVNAGNKAVLEKLLDGCWTCFENVFLTNAKDSEAPVSKPLDLLRCTCGGSHGGTTIASTNYFKFY